MSAANRGLLQGSTLGQKQTFRGAIAMSALPLKADMCGATGDVRYGPIADIGERNSLLDLRLLLSQFWLGFKIGSGFVLRCAGTAFEP